MDISGSLQNIMNKFPDTLEIKDLSPLIDALEVIKSCSALPEDESGKIFRQLYHSLESEKFSARIILRFELLWHIKDPDYTKNFIDYIISTDELSFSQKYYLYQQMVSNLFVTPKSSGRNVTLALRSLYALLYNEFSDYVNVTVDYYKSGERNQNLYFVITNQLLSLSHGPTKTALDRCYELIKNQKKQVFLINTGEMNTVTGYFPLLQIYQNKYIEKYSEFEFFPYKDTLIPFIQMPNCTPDYDSAINLLNTVDNYKPYCIFHIGGRSILTDLCSRIVPTISISTVPSGLCTTEGTFQVIGHPLTSSEKETLKILGKPEIHVIESLFTSNFKKQASQITRKDIGLPADKFILLVVGARLTFEVTNEFLEALLPLTEKGAHFAFAGNMDTYGQKCSEYPKLKDHSTYLGFQDDMLAVSECCNLYVNPYRIGGGTSVAEAMSKGIPCVSIKYGDVALGAGGIFCVSNYEEMAKKIEQYMNEPDYYNRMSEAALKRAKELMDTHNSFNNILNEFQKRITVLEKDM